jgi:hypothetical protein
LKRSPLIRKRRLYRVWHRPDDDKITPELMEALWRRDKGCVLFQIEPGHECHDKWGNPHGPDRRDLITPEHFWEDYAVKGKRAPSDLAHTVLLCAFVIINAPSAVRREAFRDWVATHG